MTRIAFDNKNMNRRFIGKLIPIAKTITGFANFLPHHLNSPIDSVLHRDFKISR